MTDDQAALLRDKYVLWERASREGPMDLRDYNRRAAEALKAALCDAAETIRERDWRPIVSAPRDGTHIILAFGQDGVMEGWWEDEDPGPYPWKFVDRGVSGSPFTRGEHLNGAREVRGGPSHWMPLPADPIAKLKAAPLQGAAE